MKILLIGCVESSAYLLNELIHNKKNICGVVTKKASGFNSDFVDLSEICGLNHIPYVYYSKDRYEMFLDFVKGCGPNLIYCFGWSHLLREDIIAAAKLGVVGFHPAALPQNRGRHPLIWAVALGLKSTASTFFMITPGTDDGDIISQMHIDISETDTARELYDKILATAGRQVIQFTDDFERGTVQYRKQNPSLSNRWRKRSKQDGRIDFRMSAVTIYNLVRALTKPYVGAHFEYNGQEYRVWSSQVMPDQDGVYDNMEFGKVLEVYSPTSFLVKTGENLLKIIQCDEIQLSEGDYL